MRLFIVGWVVLLASCGESGSTSCRGDAASSDGSADRDDEARSLEGAALHFVCGGPNVAATFDFNFEEVRTTVLPDGMAGLSLTAIVTGSIAPPLGSEVGRGVGLDSMPVPCRARFVPLQKESLSYLNLSCDLGHTLPGSGAFMIDVHVRTNKANFPEEENAQVVGMSSATSVCDATIAGSFVSYTFTFAAAPPRTVLNASRSLGG